MRKLHTLLALALLGASGTGTAATLRLDTGYNHGASTPGFYGPGDPVDKYWIKIASYEPHTGPIAVAPAFIYHGATIVAGPTFAPVVSGVKRLGPRLSSASTPGTDVSNKAYAIYRKCFCLLSTQGASLNFRVRGDDQSMVWLNSISNIVAGPGEGWGGMTMPSLVSKPTNPDMFREGRNCLYVLVEDFWGGTSFSLNGSVSAPGLMPMMAEGVEASFGACPCPEPKPGTAAAQEQSAMVESIQRAVLARQASAPDSEAQARGAENAPR